MLTKAKLDATSHRWIAALACYDFTVTYPTGTSNCDADGLSRKTRLFTDTVKAICEAAIAQMPLADYISQQLVHLSAGDDTDPCFEFSNVDWAAEQAKDPVLGKLIVYYCTDLFPRGGELKNLSLYIRKYLRERTQILLDEGVLYRIPTVDGQEVRQLLLPKAYRAQALKGLHDDVGHPGKEKPLWLARQKLYWPRLESDVVNMIERCGRCKVGKTPVRPTANLVPIETTRPMELVCILDFLKGTHCHSTSAYSAKIRLTWDTDVFLQSYNLPTLR